MRPRQALADWLDVRTGYRRLLREGLYEAVPVRGAWWYTLGSATLTLIGLQLVTGIFLLFVWRRLDEILHQRSAVVDNAPEDPVEVESVRR